MIIAQDKKNLYISFQMFSFFLDPDMHRKKIGKGLALKPT